MREFFKKHTTVLKIITSLFFIGWLLYKVKWQDVWLHAQSIQSAFIVWYVALILTGVALSAKKWQIIARFKGFQRTWLACSRAYVTGMFVNNFLPGFIGGDAFRAYWLGKQKEGYTLAVSTVVFDRMSGLFTAACVTILFALMSFDAVLQSSLWTFFVVFLAIFIVGVVFWGSLWRQVSELSIVQSVVRFLPQKIQVFLFEVRDYFQRSILLSVLSFSFLFNIIGIGLANLVLFRAFGATVPVTDFFAVIFLISMVSSIPISVNNISIKEWAYYTFFTLIHVNPELAVTVAITSRFLQMIISFIALPDFLQRKKMDDFVIER